MLREIKQDLRTDKQYLKSRREYYAEHKMAIKAVAKELSLPKDTPISAYAQSDLVFLGICGGPAELKEIFRAFRKLGYEPDQRPGIKPEATFSTRFNRDNGPTFRLNFSSTVCRRIKVGTKTVEQDIYETVCD